MTAQRQVHYSILDPTGNITALVEDPVDQELQPAMAASLMRQHPSVEQVGFVRVGEDVASGALPELRMAGGEFCGNATMSAAALHALRVAKAGSDGEPLAVLMRVSGAAEPVEVQLVPEGAGGFRARVCMPQALDIERRELAFEGQSARVPLVRMEGISHVVVEAESGLFELLGNHEHAEEAVRTWCKELGTDGLGLMFLERAEGACRLTPLVYVPGSNTTFWEHSCASGSAATGMYLAEQQPGPVEVALQEPGGCLRVTSDAARAQTWLEGHVRLVEEHVARLA